MRIIRDDSMWLVLFTDGRPALCLERAALDCGYRILDLSGVLGFSEGYVREVFHRDVGLPPKLWLRWERMVVARRMLGGGMYIGEVGDVLGFAIGAGFRNEFRNIYGMVPGDFMRRRAGWIASS